MGRKIEGTFKMEGHILWMIHADIWRKTAKFCKAIILQLNNKLRKTNEGIYYALRLVNVLLKSIPQYI